MVSVAGVPGLLTTVTGAAVTVSVATTVTTAAFALVLAATLLSRAEAVRPAVVVVAAFGATGDVVGAVKLGLLPDVTDETLEAAVASLTGAPAEGSTVPGTAETVTSLVRTADAEGTDGPDATLVSR